MTPNRKGSPGKKASDRKGRAGFKVVLLKDLTPRTDVRGGVGKPKLLFGQEPGKKPGG